MANIHSKIICDFILLTPEQGGRLLPLPRGKFGCPIFFVDNPALFGHGFDCRILLPDGLCVHPGDSVSNVEFAFLSQDEVLSRANVGDVFEMWEGKIIGSGRITHKSVT